MKATRLENRLAEAQGLPTQNPQLQEGMEEGW